MHQNTHFSPAKAMAVSVEVRPTPAKAMAVSVEARPTPAKVTGVSDKQAAWPTGPGHGAHEQQRHHRLPNFARNLSCSFFETPQKHCNSNDANSMFEQAAGELRAKVMGGCRSRPGIETTHPATLQRPGPTGVKGAGGICCGARGRWRGLAGLRDDAPSEARGADGSRAGRRPRAHQAARPSRARKAARPSRAHKAARLSRARKAARPSARKR